MKTRSHWPPASTESLINHQKITNRPIRWIKSCIIHNLNDYKGEREQSGKRKHTKSYVRWIINSLKKQNQHEMLHFSVYLLYLYRVMFRLPFVNLFAPNISNSKNGQQHKHQGLILYIAIERIYGIFGITQFMEWRALPTTANKVFIIKCVWISTAWPNNGI